MSAERNLIKTPYYSPWFSVFPSAEAEGEGMQPMPDIGAPGKIRTVEVEVEPHTGGDEEEEEEEEVHPLPPPPLPSAEEEEVKGHEDPAHQGEDHTHPQDDDEEPPPPREPTPEPKPKPQAAPPSNQPQQQQQPLNLPPASVVATTLPGQKKKPKKKDLSTRDLLALHQDVGQRTKQLMEPSTPDFKPTTDWVSWERSENERMGINVWEDFQISFLCFGSDSGA